MKAEDLDKLFAEAEAKSEKIGDQIQSKKTRDERLLDCNKAKTVLFRMFRDVEGGILNLPYNFNSFQSPIDNKNVSLGVSSSLWDGEQDFVKKFQIELWGNGQEDLAKLLYPRERSRVNVFVLSDSSDESAAETFKIWDYSAKQPVPDKPRTGSPFNKFLKELKEDPENEVTLRQLFSLDSTGVTIKMTITKGDDPWPDFKFEIYHGKKDDYFKKITPEAAEKLYKKNGVNLLDMMEKPRADEELDKILKTRLLGVSVGGSASGFARNEATVGFDDDDEDEDGDDIPMSFDGDSDDSKKTSKSKADAKPKDSEDLEFDKIMEEFNMDDD